MQLSKNYLPEGRKVVVSKNLVGVPGFEPGTSSLSGTRSNQLSYTPFFAPKALRRASPFGLACHAKLKAANAGLSEAWWRQPGSNR